MDPVNLEPTLEEMLDDPIVQPLMRHDNVCADDVRRIVHEARKSYNRRGLSVERNTPPDPSAYGSTLMTTIALLLLAASNAVQKDFHGGSDRLLRFFLRQRWPEAENDLQMKVVADHAYKVPGQAQAIIRVDFPSFPGGFEDLGEPDRGPTRPLFVERLHEIGEAVGLGDGNSVDADQGGRHVGIHGIPAERRQRRPQVVAFYFLDHQGRQHLVCAFLDDSGEQALLVAELIVDVAFRSAGALDDRVDACRGVALFKKDLGGRLKKGLPSALAPRGLYSRSHSFAPMHHLTGNAYYRKRQW
ncbi:hypothetical protein MES4922_20177 [Mesorhizobium ventifaucium]|uniref:Uncharacterized protein n=1 Tax=Mesorhizobium ventifaucium TaxID=666020 RepID=A0ABM9DPM0_9HYPH|nr:hypothetical protein MES4922_20177 [Mesorhizobium ventifaucium]